MLVVGVDENGLGPRLGPLVATALVAEVDDYDADRFRSMGVALQVGDSKQTSAFGKMAHAEGVALALAEEEIGRCPEDLDDLLEALTLDGLLTLRAPCPDAKTSRQCWQEATELPAYGGDIAEGRAIVRSLRRRGFRVRRVRTTLACVSALNDALAAGRTKLQVDLELFERLVLDAAAWAKDRSDPESLECICGLVGGIRNYSKYFRRFNGAKAVEEKKGLYTYSVPNVGSVRFEIKADDQHLPVGLASMVGKYVRELTMARIIDFYRKLDPELPKASGYHDSVTTRFIDGTAPLRKKLEVYQGCFRRKA